jgi:hypothetical protein
VSFSIIICFWRLLLLLWSKPHRKPDAASLRRIRILPRSGGGGGSIAVKKALLPLEILELKQGQVSNAIVCLEFAAPSNRDGDLVARLDIKTSLSGVSVELKPSLGELLQTSSALQNKMSADLFDATMGRLQGFQRVSSNFSTNKRGGRSAVSSLPKTVLKHAALIPVGGTTFLTWKTNADAKDTDTDTAKANANAKDNAKDNENHHKLRLMGGLPASTDLVFVWIECNDKGVGSITVCCDHAMAVNSILNLIKHAVSA